MKWSYWRLNKVSLSFRNKQQVQTYCTLLDRDKLTLKLTQLFPITICTIQLQCTNARICHTVLHRHRYFIFDLIPYTTFVAFLQILSVLIWMCYNRIVSCFICHKIVIITLNIFNSWENKPWTILSGSLKYFWFIWLPNVC